MTVHTHGVHHTREQAAANATTPNIRTTTELIDAEP
jgi:hypothetical protein